MLSLQWLFREILAIIHENGDSDATRARSLVKRFHDLARRIPLHSPAPRKLPSKAPTWRIEQRAESLRYWSCLTLGCINGISSIQPC